MSGQSDKICCGDTKFCGECILHKTHGDALHSDLKSLTLNTQGQCDFYSGPSKIVLDTRTLKVR